MALLSAASLKQLFDEFSICCCLSLFLAKSAATPNPKNRSFGVSVRIGGVGVAATGGGAKMTPWQPARSDADFFTTSRRPGKSATCQTGLVDQTIMHKVCHNCSLNTDGFLSGIIRQNWNDTEKISMAPAQG